MSEVLVDAVQRTDYKSVIIFPHMVLVIMSNL